MLNKKGFLVVISGPSGVGKGTISAKLLARDKNLTFSVSATTRARRPDEREGIHYFFKSRDEFEAMIQENAFLEYTRVFNDNYYGTPRAYVEEKLREGRDVLLDIDVVGAMNVMNSVEGAVTIFIAPPSMAQLKDRLIKRGTEPLDVVERRFHVANQEIEYLEKYDYVVVNDVLEKAVDTIAAILTAERSRTYRNKELKNQILGRL